MEHVVTRLDAADFQKLVAGEAVSLTGYTNGREVKVRLILADMGWGEMLRAVGTAEGAVTGRMTGAGHIEEVPREDEPCIIPPADPLRVP